MWRSTADQPVVDARGIVRRYPGGTTALDGACLQVHAGEFIAVHGPSGAGKSTLLNILGLLDRPDAGEYTVTGVPTTQAPEARLNRLRAEALGFVFQDAHVLPLRAVTDNLALALAACGSPRSDRSARIAAALAEVGLSDRAESIGRSLSGGERQRLAIARALVTEPAVVLADEPTGNLDEDNAAGVIALLRAAASRGAAVIMITHDRRHTPLVDRVVHLRDGRVEAQA